MSFGQIKSSRLYQQIAERIAQMVVDGALTPGERLPGEHELARMLGVSRGTVREAMIALEAGGLVEVVNGNGSYIRADVIERASKGWSKSFENEPGAIEQFELREILEPEAVARAALLISDAQIEALGVILDRMSANDPARGSFEEAKEFIGIIARSCGNSALAALIDELWTLRGGRLWGTLRERVLEGEHRQRAIEKRRRILAALRARDAAAARAASEDYLATTKVIFFGEDR